MNSQNLTTLFISIIVVAVVIVKSKACNCSFRGVQETNIDLISNYEEIYMATTISYVKNDWNTAYFSNYNYTKSLKITAVYHKGKSDYSINEIFEITTCGDDKCCEFNLVAGQDYLIFSNRKTISLCSKKGSLAISSDYAPLLDTLSEINKKLSYYNGDNIYNHNYLEIMKDYNIIHFIIKKDIKFLGQDN